jgi:hypothetical protein
MKRQILSAFVFVLCFMSAQFGFVPLSDAQSAINPQKDLFGENMGDFIMMQWSAQNGAAEYFVYTSTSSEGPWALLFGVSDMSGGAKVHRTPEARLVDLCYKVEATDATGVVIRAYQPICVPKYTG